MAAGRVFSSAYGPTVSRVSSRQAADLRWFLSWQAKSNGIDAGTLAQLPLSDLARLRPLVLPEPRGPRWPAGAPATGLPAKPAQHKRRIRDLARHLRPLSPLTWAPPTWPYWNATPTWCAARDGRPITKVEVPRERRRKRRVKYQRVYPRQLVRQPQQLWRK